MKTIQSLLTVKEITREGENKQTMYDDKNRIISMIQGNEKKVYAYNDNLKVESVFHCNELQYISVYENDIIIYTHNIKQNLMIEYTYNRDSKLILKEVKDLISSEILCKLVYRYNKEGNLKSERLYKNGILYSDFVYSYTNDLITVKKYYNKHSYYIIDIIDRSSGILMSTTVMSYNLL